MQDISEIARMLHLEHITVTIYVEVLTHGALSKDQIRKLTMYSDDKIEEGIKELLEKGLLHTINDNHGKELYQAMSVLQLEERLEREREAIMNLKRFVLPQIQQPQKLGLMKYEGWEGIRKVYLEVLEEAIQTKEPILAFENIPDKFTSPIGQSFLDKYLNKRFENEVLAKVIAPDTKTSREYQEENQNKLTQIVIIKNFHIKGTINIVGDLVMSYSTIPPQGTLRRDIREADDLKEIFRYIWRTNHGSVSKE